MTQIEDCDRDHNCGHFRSQYCAAGRVVRARYPERGPCIPYGNLVINGAPHRIDDEALPVLRRRLEFVTPC